MKVHSVVDLITNSSTELFVVDPTRFTVDEIESKLDALYQILNRKHPGEIAIADYDELDTYESSWGGTTIYKEYKKGDILLFAEDSEWGYETLEMIEAMFGAKRYHLG